MVLKSTSEPFSKDGWRRVFDPRTVRRVERPRFYEGCKMLGYSKDHIWLIIETSLWKAWKKKKKTEHEIHGETCLFLNWTFKR